MLLSQSGIKTWKRCRQKWSYRYTEGLRPVQRIARIDLGEYGHALLEAHYSGKDWREASEEYWQETTKDMFMEEVIQFEEVRSMAEALVEQYLFYHREDGWKPYLVEQDFKVPIPNAKGNSTHTKLRGRIDLVVEDDLGRIWLVDHKFTSRDLERYEDGLVLDEQANAYLWAVTQILGRAPAGIAFNLIRTKLPTIPKILKDGSLSKNKGIDTTYDVYLKAIHDNGLSEDDYTEVLAEIKEREKPFFARHRVERTREEIEDIGKEIYTVSQDIRRNKSLVYRNATNDCTWDCEFRELCIMERKGIDATDYKMNFQRKKEGGEE